MVEGQTDIPKKKSIAWATVNGVFIGAMVGLGINTGVDLVFDDLAKTFPGKDDKGKKLPITPSKRDSLVNQIVTVGIGGWMAVTFAGKYRREAKEHNAEVDKIWAERVQAGDLAKSQTTENERS
ncbi:MAG: hypothetical protein P8P30_06165 [Rickettsiales bacterium]|nr:hypothetical protein [Rickettsiales bacterium]